MQCPVTSGNGESFWIPVYVVFNKTNMTVSFSIVDARNKMGLNFYVNIFQIWFHKSGKEVFFLISSLSR